MQENAFLSSRDSVNENCIKQWKSRAEAAEYCVITSIFFNVI